MDTTYNESGVSWSAVLAGAAAAAALSLILILLGFGLGLSVVSPWQDSGVGMGTIGVSTVIWLILIHIAASGLGGYLAGRLRVKWADVHTDEVYFRDTAHGLLTWAVSTLLAAALVTGSVAAAITGTAKLSAELADAAALASLDRDAEGAPNPMAYFVDDLLRPDPEDDLERAGEDVRRELSVILFRALMDDEPRAEDRQYLAQVVARHTGLSQQEAQARVTNTLNRAEGARQTAMEALDDARSAAAATALWLFIALLCGAFVASFLATIGGRQRDTLPAPTSSRPAL
jgi:hypothetical protein